MNWFIQTFCGATISMLGVLLACLFISEINIFVGGTLFFAGLIFMVMALPKDVVPTKLVKRGH